MLIFADSGFVIGEIFACFHMFPSSNPGSSRISPKKDDLRLKVQCNYSLSNLSSSWFLHVSASFAIIAKLLQQRFSIRLANRCCRNLVCQKSLTGGCTGGFWVRIVLAMYPAVSPSFHPFPVCPNRREPSKFSHGLKSSGWVASCSPIFEETNPSSSSQLVS